MNKRLKPVKVLFLGLLLSAAANLAQAGSLHEGFGGDEALAAVVDQFLLNLRDDVRVNHIFFEYEQGEIREQLGAMLCDGLELSCSGFRHADLDLNLSNGEVDLLLRHLQQALHNSNMSLALQQRLVRKLATVPVSGAADQPLASL